jgi:hypothetical protein
MHQKYPNIKVSIALPAGSVSKRSCQEPFVNCKKKEEEGASLPYFITCHSSDHNASRHVPLASSWLAKQKKEKLLAGLKGTRRIVCPHSACGGQVESKRLHTRYE